MGKFSSLLVAISFSFQGYSQPGTLDANFGVYGIATEPAPSYDTDVAVQPADSKIVVVSADANTAIFRYNTNGSFDNSFRVNGKNITDGALDGTGIDKVRMKIYNKTTGAVIYDNQQGASDAALPTHAVGANNVVVISGSNSSNIIKSRTTQNAEMKARMGAASNGSDGIAYANPSTNNFSLIVQATVGRKNIDASDRCVWKSN